MNKKSVSRVAVNLIKTTFEDLKVKTSSEFNRLLEEQEEFELSTQEEYEDSEIDNYFDRRNELSGNVFECFILKVTRDGIVTRDSHDGEENLIKFSDLASLTDQISLLELMVEKLK